VKDFFILNIIWDENAQLLDKWGIFVNSLHIPCNTVLIFQFSSIFFLKEYWIFFHVQYENAKHKVECHFIKIPIWYHPESNTNDWFPGTKDFLKSKLHCNFLPELKLPNEWNSENMQFTICPHPNARSLVLVRQIGQTCRSKMSNYCLFLYKIDNLIRATGTFLLYKMWKLINLIKKTFKFGFIVSYVLICDACAVALIQWSLLCYLGKYI
jgi:hypothetical protein